MTYNCRGCGFQKSESEVMTRFQVYGKERVRFKLCEECRRLARLVNKQRKEKARA